MAEPSRIVSVEILGRRYPVRSALDAAYVAELAAYVHEKMQAAADETPAGDSLKIAVLAALNIADEYFRCRHEDGAAGPSLAHRAAAIEQLVDEVLAKI